MLTEDWTQENSLVSTPRLLPGSLPVSYARFTVKLLAGIESGNTSSSGDIFRL